MQVATARAHGGRAATVALTAFVCLSMVSCAAERPVGGTQAGMNEAQWTMPLDEFIVHDPGLGNYAEQLLIGECMVPAGYEWSVPWQDPDALPPEDFNAIGLRLFNADTAQKWGYHFAPPRDEAAAQAWAQFVERRDPRNTGPAFEESFETCADAARDPETSADVDGFNYVMGLMSQAVQVADEEASVIAAVVAWRECLSAEVSFAVPEDPMEMPTPAVAQQFGLSGPSATAVASAEEIRVALADANCRESSGWSTTRYKIEWAEQLKLIGENRDQLDRIRAQSSAHEKTLLATIAEHAPPAP